MGGHETQAMSSAREAVCVCPAGNAASATLASGQLGLVWDAAQPKLRARRVSERRRAVCGMPVAYPETRPPGKHCLAEHPPPRF